MDQANQIKQIKYVCATRVSSERTNRSDLGYERKKLQH